MLIDNKTRRELHIGQLKWINGELIYSVKHSFGNNVEVKSLGIQDSVTLIEGYRAVIDDGSELSYKRQDELITVLKDDNIVITCCNMCPNKEVTRYIKEHKGSLKRIAEIGVRYGSTYRGYARFVDGKIDLFELNPKYVSLVKREFLRYDTEIFEGDAAETLKALSEDVKYDLVYFDASHHYDVDRAIMDSLLSHLTEDSVVIFDDSWIEDVAKLIEEFADEKFTILIQRKAKTELIKYEKNS